MAAAAKPSESVSQAIRRSVAAPATSSVTLAILAATGQTAQDFAHAGVKAESAENQHQPGSRVQPAVKKEAQRPAHHNRANESKRQLQGKRRLRCEVRGLPWSGRLGRAFVSLIVRRHIGLAA